MNKRLIVPIIFLLLLAAATVYAAGTVTSSTEWVSGQNTKIVTLNWASDEFSVVPFAKIDKIDGWLFGIQVNPTGTIEADYDVYLKDYDESGVTYYSYDNRDATLTQMDFLVLTSQVPMYSNVGLSVSGVGDLEAGEVKLWIAVPK